MGLLDVLCVYLTFAKCNTIIGEYTTQQTRSSCANRLLDLSGTAPTLFGEWLMMRE
jgi:hypothetical protein